MTKSRFSDLEPQSSIDSLLRAVQQHHVQLSALADTKASILITVSSIALTVALSRSNDPHLRPALLTLAVSCLLSLLLAIIAVLPTFAPKEARNVLFFGHFSAMSEDAFLDEMERIMRSDAAMYETTLRDIYSHGIYLYRKKYRFLRFAYVALLAGFILATAVEVGVMWMAK